MTVDFVNAGGLAAEIGRLRSRRKGRNLVTGLQ